MLGNKFFLQSKTIIAAIGVLFVQLGPLLGISFTGDDATALNDGYVLISEAVDTIVTSLLGLVALWGRVTAKTDLTLMPPTNTVNSPWLIGVLASVLFLAGCITPTGGNALTPQVRLFQVESNYAIAKEEVAAYAALPFCTEAVIISCADPETVIKLDEADDKAEEAINLARNAVAVFETTGNIADADLVSASSALRVLLTVLATATLA